MPIVSAKVTSWICDKFPTECQHIWQFSGYALSESPYDMTAEQLLAQFPETPFIGLQVGQCPSCYMRGVISPLAKSVDLATMSEVIVASDEELAAKEVDEVDDLGNPVMVDSGEVKQELAIVDGKADVVETPIMTEKKRELTKTELTELKQQRDDTLDQLESIAVKEVSDEAPRS